MNTLEQLAGLTVPRELLTPKLKLSWGARMLGAYIFLHPEAKLGGLSPGFGTPEEVSQMLAELDREGGGKGGVVLNSIIKTISPLLSPLNSNLSPPYKIIAVNNAREARMMSAGLEHELAEALNRSNKSHLSVVVKKGDDPHNVAHLLCSRFVARCEGEGIEYVWPAHQPVKGITSRAVVVVAKKVVEGGRSIDVLVTGIVRNDWLMTKCGALWPYVVKYFDRVYCSGLRKIGESALPHLRERYSRVERRYVRAIEDRDWSKQQRLGELLNRINGDIQLFVRADGGRQRAGSGFPRAGNADSADAVRQPGVHAIGDVIVRSPDLSPSEGGDVPEAGDSAVAQHV